MRVLIVEDNRRVAAALKEALRSAYIVDVAHSGQEALEITHTISFDVILLDLGLPDMGGQDVYQQLREHKVESPVLIISGDDTINSKVNILDMGADDYITKPFNGDELKARIRKAIRRHSVGEAGNLITLGKLELDSASRTLMHDGHPIDLRRKEFDLLEYMMHNPGRTLTRQMIVDHVWESGDGMWTNAVDVHVKYLRDKIDRPFKTHFIKTVHGVGYKLEVPVTEGAVATT